MASQGSIQASGRINVLSIDGGGIRGIIPTVILGQLASRIKLPLHSVFDLIAGTSTGGIIALGIGSAAKNGEPYSPDELLELYVSNGPRIFKKSWFTSIRKWLRPKYDPRPLEETLKAYFRDADLNTALTPLLISSYDLHSQLPFFFKSHLIAGNPSSSYNWKLTEVARATSAAPTSFPPLHLSHDGTSYTFVDGGVFANNPAMAAYAEANRLYPEAIEFVIVAVGTGDRDDRITYERAKKWGLLGWARQIAPVMIDSVSEAVDYELDWIVRRNVSSKQYRLQPRLACVSNEMDDVSPKNMARLRALAERFLTANAPLVDEICDLLKAGRGSNLPGNGLTLQPANDSRRTLASEGDTPSR